MPGNVMRIAKLPTIQRLPSYLRILKMLHAEGREQVSTTTLAALLQLQAIVVRKDLSITGIVGKPRVGYCVVDLIRFIEEYLDWNNTNEAFLIGVGHLGTALMGYSGFEDNGMRIVAAFDTDPEKVGQTIHGKQVLHLDKFADLTRRMHVQIAILTVPANHAQKVADVIISAGIRGIWNFTPAKLEVPEGVVSQQQNIAEGFAVLSTRLKHMSEGGSGKIPEGDEDELDEEV